MMGAWKKCFRRRPFLRRYAVAALALIATLIYASYKLKIIFVKPVCTNINGDIVSNHLMKTEYTLLLEGDKLMNRAHLDNSFNLLPRVTSPDIKEELMSLLSEFMILLKKYDVEYFMSQGMLLGSFFFHDLIPWDDDIDLMVNIKDVNKLRAMFREPSVAERYEAHSFHDPVNMYGPEVIHEEIPMDNTLSCGSANKNETCYQQGKIYLKTSPHAGVYEWRYPFVDFIFYATNETHMYNHEMWSRDGQIEIPLQQFYPFHLRPYNRFWILAPHEPLKFLHAKFTRGFRCKQSYWNHKEEHRNYNYKILSYKTNCENIKNCYAHVRRRPPLAEEVSRLKSPNNKSHVVEELVLGNTVIQSVLLPEAFEAAYDLTLD